MLAIGCKHVAGLEPDGLPTAAVIPATPAPLHILLIYCCNICNSERTHRIATFVFRQVLLSLSWNAGTAPIVQGNTPATNATLQ
jgi:hypothetical protein